MYLGMYIEYLTALQMDTVRRGGHNLLSLQLHDIPYHEELVLCLIYRLFSPPLLDNLDSYGIYSDAPVTTNLLAKNSSPNSRIPRSMYPQLHAVETQHSLLLKVHEPIESYHTPLVTLDLVP